MSRILTTVREMSVKNLVREKWLKTVYCPSKLSVNLKPLIAYTITAAFSTG